VDSIALPGQQVLWVFTMVFATVSVLVTPVLAISRRLMGRPPLWPLVLVNVSGFGLMLWLARQPVGAWAWD
jgi:hypothetical protein